MSMLVKHMLAKLISLLRETVKKCYIQVSYYMNEQSTIEREFDSFKNIKDASPKSVLSLDKGDLSHNGITHLNIEDFLLMKRDIVLL